jgi:predicted esterase
MKSFCICIVTGLLATVSFGQLPGKTIRFYSANAMFPDTARAKGHTYNGKHYDAATHYSDSSILVYVPTHFSPKKITNLIFWFHGWGNNIDSALQQYDVLEQLEASGRNAVFVFPEGPKNAPDSYGGKLEQPLVFQALVKEVEEKLKANGILSGRKTFNIDRYSITLAGHSGAYRVISRILNQSPVQEVILFDAMYGGNEQYLQWLSVPEHRFIHIYTKDGGTFDNSQLIMRTLTDSLHMPFFSGKEEDVNDTELKKHQKLFIYSSKKHNEVITYNRNWERFLRNIPAEK